MDPARLRFIQTRHEEMAAFMACGHAKYTGDVGVCMATSGPGAIHLLNGLYDAKLDHQPVVAIVGQTYVRAMGGDFQQEVNLLQLYSDVASAFVQQVNEPSSVRHLVDRALRVAQAERTVTCVIFPADVQEMDAVSEQPKKTHTVHSGIGYWKPRVIPAKDQLQQAADILNAGERVAMLVGQGALRGRPTRSWPSPTRPGPGWPRPCSAKTWSPTTCPTAPAASACLAPSRRGT